MFNLILTTDVSRDFLGSRVHRLNSQRCPHSWHRAENFSEFVLPDTLKIDSLALPVLRFLCKSFPKLLKLTL